MLWYQDVAVLLCSWDDLRAAKSVQIGQLGSRSPFWPQRRCLLQIVWGILRRSARHMPPCSFRANNGQRICKAAPKPARQLVAKSLCQYRLRFLISGYEIGKNLGSGNLDTCQKPIQAGNCSLFQPFSISLRSAGAPKKMLREQCQWCLHHTALATAARLAALLTRSTLSGRTGYVHLSSLFQQESGYSAWWDIYTQSIPILHLDSR